MNRDKHHEMQNKNITKISYQKTEVVTFYLNLSYIYKLDLEVRNLIINFIYIYLQNGFDKNKCIW